MAPSLLDVHNRIEIMTTYIESRKDSKRQHRQSKNHTVHTKQWAIADFAPGAKFSGAIWRVTVNNWLHHRL